LVIPSYNSFFPFIRLCKRGNIYPENECVYDKDKHPVFHYKNPEQTFSKLVQTPFNQKDSTAVCFNKKEKEDLGNIYDKEDQIYTFLL
jgi:hypothetical protein